MSCLSKALSFLSLILILVGALNWGLWGFLQIGRRVSSMQLLDLPEFGVLNSWAAAKPFAAQARAASQKIKIKDPLAAAAAECNASEQYFQNANFS